MSDDRVERLRAIPLFSGCSDKELKFIATRVEDLDIPAGRVLCREGESGGEFFIILNGSADVRKGGRTIRTMGPGDYFGEIALVDDGPRTATVTAGPNLRCLVLGVSQFHDVLYQNADIAVNILRTLAQRLRASTTLRAS